MSKGGNVASTSVDKGPKTESKENSTSPNGKSTELSELRKIRGDIRSQFTKTKTLAFEKIEANGSRTYVKTLVEKAAALNEESNSLTRKVAMLLPADAVEADCVRQDSYNEDLEALQSALATYLSLRKNDAPSDTKSEPESNNPTPVSPTPATIIQAEVPDISEWCK